jgi:hypothetical protein
MSFHNSTMPMKWYGNTIFMYTDSNDIPSIALVQFFIVLESDVKILSPKPSYYLYQYMHASISLRFN